MTGTQPSPRQARATRQLPRISAKVLAVADPDTTTSSRATRVTAFVGPTGVGKTTTLAKIAAHAIAPSAASQWRSSPSTPTAWPPSNSSARWPRCSTRTFEVAFTPAELKPHGGDAARRTTTACSIDTTGRSPFDDRLAAQALHGDAAVPTTRARGPVPRGERRGTSRCEVTILRRLRQGRASELRRCLTKWDETRTPGEALSFAIENVHCRSRT